MLCEIHQWPVLPTARPPAAMKLEIACIELLKSFHQVKRCFFHSLPCFAFWISDLSYHSKQRLKCWPRQRIFTAHSLLVDKILSYQYRMSLAECLSYLTIEQRDRNADSRNLDNASMLARCVYITCKSCSKEKNSTQHFNKQLTQPYLNIPALRFTS